MKALFKPENHRGPMIHLFRVITFLVIGLLFTACGQTITANPSPLPSPTAAATTTYTPIPSPTRTATPETTPTQAYTVPTLLPMIEPTLAQELLSKAFSIKFPRGLNGHPLHQITGWEYGFRRNWCNGYEWLDSNHLIMFPTTGQESTPNFGVLDETSSVVINMDSGMVWLPTYRLAWNCSNWVPWSSELGFLVLSDLNSAWEGVSIYTADGRLSNHYPGKLISVSPSGTKILIDDRWIDLKSGKMVDFEWSSDFDEYMYFPQPLWSSDEMQVYTCCYKYGNARTGESFHFPYDHLSLDGKEATGALFHSTGEWVLNDSYLLIQWDFFYDTNPGFIPLFDPKARTLRNLNLLAGIPADVDGLPNCQMASASPDGKSIWATCYSGDYLIDLSTFKSVEYPMNNSYEYPTWSANGEFAWMETEPRQLLSVPSQKLSPLPDEPLLDSELWWHPTDNILAYLSEDGQRLELLNAQTMSNQEIILPAIFQYFIWSPNGDSIALVGKDRSLWQADYPKFEKFEQLTLPFPGMGNVNWSPDSRSIAFISESDLYIVETNK